MTLKAMQSSPRPINGAQMERKPVSPLNGRKSVTLELHDAERVQRPPHDIEVLQPDVRIGMHPCGI